MSAPAAPVTRVEAWDLRFPLSAGAGTDARHTDPVYSLAVCRATTADGHVGTGYTLTLGEGNDLVARAIGTYGHALVGSDPDCIVSGLGRWWADLADHSQYRWLGPHKGVTHLALAAVTGAVVDLWSRRAGRPLWQLLLDAPTDALLAMIDHRTLNDVVDRAAARELVGAPDAAHGARFATDGLPGYDTSIGWLGYPIEALVERATAAAEAGFGAVKVKIGSPDAVDDVARVRAVRDAVGPDRLVMVDANQCYDVARAIEVGQALADLDVFWFEEPVHPDDVAGYRKVRDALGGMRIAGGEHLPNQVSFKTFLDAGALDVAQADVVRLGGLPEFLGTSLLAAHHGIPVAPHAGDMGQIHQHLMPLLQARFGIEPLPLEHIPHLRHAFAEPADVADGRYRLPTTPGASSELTEAAYAAGTKAAEVTA